MSSERKITVWESQYDGVQLQKNKYNFNIAKAVSDGSGGAAAANLIWQSKAIAPITEITWNTVYALNWTATLPAKGVSIQVGGTWQKCAKGEMFELTPSGYWKSSQLPPVSGFMGAYIDYSYPGAEDGIHVVIGQQNASGGFDPIFSDTTGIPIGGAGQWQPQELVQWWYQAGTQSSSMISNITTKIGGVDLSAPAPSTDQYAYWTTFLYSDRSWVNTETAPNSALFAPPHSAADFNNSRSKNNAAWRARVINLRLYPGLETIIVTVAVPPHQQRPIIDGIVQYFWDHVLNEGEYSPQ